MQTLTTLWAIFISNGFAVSHQGFNGVNLKLAATDVSLIEVNSITPKSFLFQLELSL